MKNLIAAMLYAQADMPSLIADSTANTGKYKYDYATIDNVLSVVQPALSKHGLLLMQSASTTESGAVVITTSVAHTSGELWTPTPLTIAPEGRGPQDMGKAITYGRRYAIVTMFNLAVADDDANDTKTEITRRPTAPVQQRQVPKQKPVQQPGPATLQEVQPISGGHPDVLPPDPVEDDNPLQPWIDASHGNHEPKIDFPEAAANLIFLIHKEDSESHFKPMTEKQYGFLKGLVCATVGSNPKSDNWIKNAPRLFALMFGRKVNSKDMPGWRCKFLIDALNDKGDTFDTEMAAAINTLWDISFFIAASEGEEELFLPASAGIEDITY